MTGIIKYASAKVNLMLHITGKENEYHKIQSVFTFVPSLSDILEFDTSSEFTKESGQVDGVSVDDNLIHRTRDFICDHFKNARVPDIKIKKNIPIGAGLGGASSDAACILNFFMEYIGADNETKIAIAKESHKLGMDVPVCLRRHIFDENFFVLDGIGKFDEIKRTACFDKFFVLIENCNRKLRTKDVFDNFHGPFEKKQKIDRITIDFLKKTKNSLQETAVSMEPGVRKSLINFEKTNASIARMSGSGAACFGIYINYSDFILAKKALYHAHTEPI
jgi:4-diphosphocytidyl-2-C-methyl-D-erythritol kinase